MAATAITTLIHYSCSVCTKCFGDSHHRCAQHVRAKGTCRAKGATVKTDTVIIGRNDRNVGGRLAQPQQLDRLEGDAANHDSDMEGAGWLVSPASRPAPGPSRSGMLSVQIRHTYIYISMGLILTIYTNPWDLSLPSIQIRHSYLTYPLVPEKYQLDRASPK